MSDNFFKALDAATFMRHIQIHNNDNALNNTTLTTNDARFISQQLENAEALSTMLTDQLELDEQPIESYDLLDALASLGLKLVSIEDTKDIYNYSSLAYFYCLNPESMPSVTNYIESLI
jgi:hypothetical protein